MNSYQRRQVRRHGTPGKISPAFNICTFIKGLEKVTIIHRKSDPVTTYMSVIETLREVA